MLTFFLVAVAILLPLLLLLDLWRGRRVVLPEDATEQQLDPILNRGMSRKTLFAIVILAELMLLLVAIAANEPGRQEIAANRLHEFAVHEGSRRYVTFCLQCHGLTGRGFLEGTQYVGRPLNKPEFQPTDPDEVRKTRDLIYKTIENGRPGTLMPAWGNTAGGPLNYEQLSELVSMIMSGGWELVREAAQVQAVQTPTPGPITDPVAAGRRIVTEGACVSCHAVSGRGGAIGPPLDGVGGRQIAGVLPFSRESAVLWVRNPAAQKPGTPMPPYPFRDEELNAVAAFLETLR